jgi:hypothetical protein
LCIHHAPPPLCLLMGPNSNPGRRLSSLHTNWCYYAPMSVLRQPTHTPNGQPRLCIQAYTWLRSISSFGYGCRYTCRCTRRSAGHKHPVRHRAAVQGRAPKAPALAEAAATFGGAASARLRGGTCRCRFSVLFHVHYTLAHGISLKLANPFYKTGHRRQNDLTLTARISIVHYSMISRAA